MSIAILRVSGIKTTTDLKGVGKHHIDRVSETNKDIDHDRSNENITLIKSIGTYNEMFNYITRDLKQQHEEQMEKTRASRRKTFQDKVNSDKADVACEFLMSASPEYFEGKTREDIQKWAETSLDFVTNQVGIDRENILHAVVHMDEKTPHMHVVAVPLVEKYDGRRKADVLAISRKYFIKTKEDMARVQTDYVEFLNGRGFDLERGEEKSGAKHLDNVRYKTKMAEERLSELELELEKIYDVKDLLEREKELLNKRVIELRDETTEIHNVFEERLELDSDLKRIESRTEPVKRLWGKDKGEEVRLPKKEFKRLLELAERGAGAELVVLAEKEKNVKLLKKNNELINKYNGLVGKFNNLLKSKENLEFDHDVLKEDFKKLKSDHKKLRSSVNRLADFIKSENMVNKFDEWNQKIEKQQQLEKRKRDFGMER